MVMELLKGGNLKQACSSKLVRLSDPEIAYASREILSGIGYLHKNGIIHRDLKSLNIMLSVDGDIKIIDFGLAADLANGPRIEMVGSAVWMAPEMIRREYYESKVDIWSFAVCLVEMAEQKSPHRNNIKRAMFLTATIGLHDVISTHSSSWQSAFTVPSPFPL